MILINTTKKYTKARFTPGYSRLATKDLVHPKKWTFDAHKQPSLHHPGDAVMWKTKAEWLIASFCSCVNTARFRLMFPINHILKHTAPLLAGHEGEVMQKPEDTRKFVPALLNIEHAMAFIGSTYLMDAAFGPYVCVSDIAEAHNSSSVVELGFSVVAPSYLHRAEPLAICKSLHEAMDEVHPIGKFMGFDWEALDMESIALMKEAVEHSFATERARNKSLK